MPEILITIIKIVAIVFVFVMGVASMMTLLGDRKQSAKIQNRVGPNQAKFFGMSLVGIPHFLADGIKMILKENTIPDGANKFLHTLAPALVFVPALLGWAAVPFMDKYCDGQIHVLANYQEVCDGQWHNYFQIMDLNAGLLYAFAIASVSVYGAAVAGWASNNKFSLLGGLRSTAQMISYEVSMGLSLAGILMIYGTLDLNKMVIEQGTMLWGWIPLWGIVVQPVAFFLFFLAGMAETKRAPFDLPEGESEIVAGYITEYSSMKFAVMQLAEYAATVFIAALIAVVFLGGWQVPFLYADGFYFGGIADPTLHISMPYWLVIGLRIGAMCLKVIVLVWLQFMMRWTLPRFRYDQVMVLGWKILLPLALANLFITALIVLIV
jgi:NADH-quinone oxidoreductase subunit H